MSDLLVAPLQQPLDRDGNKISVGRAPGDELRVEFTAGETAVRRPGETVILHVHPLLPARTSPTASYELLVRGRRPGGGTESHRQALPVEPVPQKDLAVMVESLMDLLEQDYLLDKVVLRPQEEPLEVHLPKQVN